MTDFNTYVTAHKNALTGTFAVWQRSPSSSTAINLDGITLAGDFTLITNAPVTFGNTSTVTTTAASRRTSSSSRPTSPPGRARRRW